MALTFIVCVVAAVTVVRAAEGFKPSIYSFSHRQQLFPLKEPLLKQNAFVPTSAQYQRLHNYETHVANVRPFDKQPTTVSAAFGTLADSKASPSAIGLENWLAQNKVDAALGGALMVLLKMFERVNQSITASSCDATGCYSFEDEEKAPLTQKLQQICLEALRSSEVIAEVSIKQSNDEPPYTTRLGGRDFSVVLSLPNTMDMQLGIPSSGCFGIWLGDTLQCRIGREMVLGGVLSFGERLRVSLGMVGIPGGQRFQLDEAMGRGGLSWSWVEAVYGLDSGGKKLIGDLSAKTDSAAVADFLDALVAEGYEIVKSEGLAMDIERLLERKVGMVGYGESAMYPPQLSILHESLPIAYLIEKSGGKSTDGLQSILDLRVPQDAMESRQVFWGSTASVDRFKRRVGPPKYDSKDTLGITGQADGQTEEEGMELILSKPRGFCEGVKRAIDTVEEALRIWGKPIYVKHEIVHNEVVVEKLKKKGAIFIEDLDDVPPKSIVVYSAHGIPPKVREQAKARELYEVDATCPLVTKVHVYVKKKAEEGYSIVLIGHRSHVEIMGTAGEAPGRVTVVETTADVDALDFSDEERLFYATQTTLSLDDCAEIVEKLKEKYPRIESIPSGSVCYATTNRQMALRQVVPVADVTFVVGSQLSSNAKRLVETSVRRGTKGYLVNHPDDIKPEMLQGVKTIALTSSASTPEETVNDVMNRLKEMGVAVVTEDDGVFERLPNWKLPRNLKLAVAAHDERTVTPT